MTRDEELTLALAQLKYVATHPHYLRDISLDYIQHLLSREVGDIYGLMSNFHLIQDVASLIIGGRSALLCAGHDCNSEAMTS